jgi:hypothetical protein
MLKMGAAWSAEMLVSYHNPETWTWMLAGSFASDTSFHLGSGLRVFHFHISLIRGFNSFEYLFYTFYLRICAVHSASGVQLGDDESWRKLLLSCKKSINVSLKLRREFSPQPDKFLLSSKALWILCWCLNPFNPHPRPLNCLIEVR